MILLILWEDKNNLLEVFSGSNLYLNLPSIYRRSLSLNAIFRSSVKDEKCGKRQQICRSTNHTLKSNDRVALKLMRSKAEKSTKSSLYTVMTWEAYGSTCSAPSSNNQQVTCVIGLQMKEAKHQPRLCQRCCNSIICRLRDKEAEIGVIKTVTQSLSKSAWLSSEIDSPAILFCHKINF